MLLNLLVQAYDQREHPSAARDEVLQGASLIVFCMRGLACAYPVHADLPQARKVRVRYRRNRLCLGEWSGMQGLGRQAGSGDLEEEDGSRVTQPQVPCRPASHAAKKCQFHPLKLVVVFVFRARSATCTLIRLSLLGKRHGR